MVLKWRKGMKKILLALAVTLLSACQPQSTKNGGGVLLTPEREYEIDGRIVHLDIYEFTPIGHSHMVCLIVVSSTGGMECFPKKPS